jgi:CheY-like chemotaxis protein
MKKVSKVMLVDDDYFTNFLNKSLLDRLGFAEEVVEKSMASDALEYLQGELQSGKIPDLIFLDINMPAMDGWGFIERYSEFDFGANRPIVIMLTSSIDPRDENRAAEIKEINAFRSKPLSPEMLQEITRTYFSNQ